MSASLVGSEMCIRDRSPQSSSPSLTASLAHVAPKTLWKQAPRCSAGVIAVSYTHLTLPTICSV
eukprot:7351446-Alexandrium_andersonii.AAC.1